MPKVEIRLPYVDYPHSGLQCPEPTLTQQHFADECDFNNVLAKWQNSGLITHLNPSQPIYADVSEFTDYQSSLELIRSAQAAFDALPSSVRDRFDNDPQALFNFVHDPSNRDEAIKLGLVPSPDAFPPVVGSAAPTAKPEPSTGTTAGSEP